VDRVGGGFGGDGAIDGGDVVDGHGGEVGDAIGALEAEE